MPWDGVSMAATLRGQGQDPAESDRFDVGWESRTCIDQDFVPLLGPDR